MLEKDIKEIINKLLNNSSNFTEVTYDVIADKNKEAEKFLSPDVYINISRTRPYPYVVESVEFNNVNFESITIRGNYATVKMNVRVKSIPVDKSISFTDNLETYDIIIEDTGKGLIITNFEFVIDTLYTDYYNHNVPYDPERVAYKVGKFISENYMSFSNIQYQYKGVSKEDIFKGEGKYNTDTFGLLYWLYRKYDITLSTPLNLISMLDSEKFREVLTKGHKYVYDIDTLLIGDILFFGAHDTSIGIYISDDKYITLEGTFPKSKDTITVKDIKENWDNFNGRVLRFNEQVK